MHRKVLWTIVVVAAVFAVGFTVAARMTSGGGEVIDRDVVAGGGGMSTASGNTLQSTIGQPVVGTSTAGNGTTLIHGFHTRIRPAVSTAAKRWEHY